MHCAPGGQTGTNIDDSEGYPWLYDPAPKRRQRRSPSGSASPAHYANNTTVLGYDLLNEPIPHFPQLTSSTTRTWSRSTRRIAAGIRQVDPNHVIILGGAQWDTNFSVFGPPFDKNVMYTLPQILDARPPKQRIQPYLDFRDKYHVPIWLGESGENNDEWVPLPPAVLNKNNIGWAFWTYKRMDATASMVSFPGPSTGTRSSPTPSSIAPPATRKSFSPSAPHSNTLAQRSRTSCNKLNSSMPT